MIWVWVVLGLCALYPTWKTCRNEPELISFFLAVTGFFLYFHRRSWIALIVYALLCAALWSHENLFERIKPSARKALVLAGKAALILVVGFLCVKARIWEGHGPAKLVALGAAFLLLSILLLFSARIRRWSEKKQLPCLTGMLAVITPIAGFYLIELVSNDSLGSMKWERAAQNLIYLTVLFLLIFFGLPWKKAAIGSFWAGCLLFGSLNHFLYIFRDNPLMPGDFLSTRTALKVAAGYQYTITTEMLKGILLCFGCIVLLSISAGYAHPSKRLRTAAAAICLAGVLICTEYLANTDIKQDYGVRMNQWDIQKAYNTVGATLGFVQLTQQLNPGQPDGYSRKKVDQLLETYKDVKADPSVQPTIIVAMCESFSDLHALGEFETSDDFMENWYARTDYLYRGNCYVSVYGGSTANTEFEFLTGNSLGFLPVGTVPYQSYDTKDMGNLAQCLKDQGYRLTALHPEAKENWNRDQVYADFGFEQFLGIGDFENPEYLRGRMSDAADFRKLIEVYEENRGQPQFIFNITMQNHGGYDAAAMEGYELIGLKKEWEKYSDVSTYLTLVQKTDQAIEELISYFETVDEPVILCIFGDHQPSVSKKWREAVLGKKEKSLTLDETQKKYATPYMIWANYDTGTKRQETDLSVNYLGALLLETAGMHGSSYIDFLQEMRQYIPAINAFGYMTTDGSWHDMDEETDGSEWVDRYHQIEYNALFDPERDLSYYTVCD